MYVTVKAFKTVNQKFAVGAPVTAADLQDDRLGLQDRVKRGFIKSAPPAAPVSPPTSAE